MKYFNTKVKYHEAQHIPYNRIHHINFNHLHFKVPEVNLHQYQITAPHLFVPSFTNPTNLPDSHHTQSYKREYTIKNELHPIIFLSPKIFLRYLANPLLGKFSLGKQQTLNNPWKSSPYQLAGRGSDFHRIPIPHLSPSIPPPIFPSHYYPFVINIVTPTGILTNVLFLFLISLIIKTSFVFGSYVLFSLQIKHTPFP